MYVNSAKIKMFPSAWRAEGINPEATLNTEENLTSLSRRLANEKHLKSYVVSRDATYDTMTFVINGYIFDLADVSSLGRPLYAGIKLKNDDGGIADFSNKTLINLVENDIATLDRVESEEATPQFCGVEFSNTELSGYEADCVIQLLDSSNQVPPTSWLNTSSAQVYNNHGSGQGSDEPKPINREMSTDILYTQAISAYSSAVLSIYGSFIDVLGAMTVNGTITTSIISAYASAVLSIYGGRFDVFAPMSIRGNIIPYLTNSYSLGSETKRFKAIYGKSIHGDSVHTSTLYGDDIFLNGGVTAYWYGLCGANGSNPIFDFYQSSNMSTYMRFDASCSSLYINFNNSYVSVYASKNFTIAAPYGQLYEKAGYINLYAVRSGAYNGYLSLTADNYIYANAYNGDIHLGYGHNSSNGVCIGAYSSYATRLQHNSYASNYNVTTTLPSRSGTLANLTGAYCASNSSTIYYPNQDDVYGATQLVTYTALSSRVSGQTVWQVSSSATHVGTETLPVYFANGVPVKCNLAGRIDGPIYNSDYPQLLGYRKYSARNSTEPTYPSSNSDVSMSLNDIRWVKISPSSGRAVTIVSFNLEFTAYNRCIFDDTGDTVQIHIDWSKLGGVFDNFFNTRDWTIQASFQVNPHEWGGELPTSLFGSPAYVVGTHSGSSIYYGQTSVLCIHGITESDIRDGKIQGVNVTITVC